RAARLDVDSADRPAVPVRCDFTPCALSTVCSQAVLTSTLVIAVGVREPNLAFELAFPFEMLGIMNGDVQSPSIDGDVERTPRQRRRNRDHPAPRFPSSRSFFWLRSP